MKCDNLTAYKGDVTIPVYGTIADAEVYLKKDVDAAIAELKEFAEDACLERDDNQTAIDELQAENAELKKKLEDVQASAYAESVDAGMRERRLKRALWLARATCAQESQYWGAYVRYVHLHENSFYEFINDDIFRRDNPNNDSFRMWSNRWRSVERKCLKKAEEYK